MITRETSETITFMFRENMQEPLCRLGGFPTSPQHALGELLARYLHQHQLDKQEWHNVKLTVRQTP